VCVPVGIITKELLPIILSLAVWGPRLARRTVLFQFDNMSVVSTLLKDSAKNVIIMQLLCSLWFYVGYYDIKLTCELIKGAASSIADYLSRCNMSHFFSLNPLASPLLTSLSPSLLQIITIGSPDWISPYFKRLFKATTYFKDIATSTHKTYSAGIHNIT